MKSKKIGIRWREKEILIDKITSISKFNPRKSIDDSKINELAKTIKKNGLLHPIYVVSKENNEYELVLGQRRKLAFIKLNRKSIRTRILTNPTEDELLRLAIIENIQRVDVEPIEMANVIEALYIMVDGNYTKVADQIGKSVSTVRMYRHMLKLNDNIKENISTKKLTLPVKTSSEIGKNFPQDRQQVVVDVVESYPQETQLKIIKELKDNFHNIHGYAKSELVIKFIKKVLKHDMGYINQVFHEFSREIRNLQNHIKDQLDKFPILRVFNNSPFNSIPYLYDSAKRFNLHNIEHIEDNYNLKRYPMNSLKTLLEHIYININKYDQDFREELSKDLLNFITVNIINKQILKTLDILNRGSKRFLEEVLPDILKKITNNQLKSSSGTVLFTFYENLYFKDYRSIVREILSSEDGDKQLKKLIIERLTKRNNFSPEVRDLQKIMLRFYNDTDESHLKSVLKKFLLKIGKICSKCESIVKKNKNADDIQICSNCNRVYCEECVKDGNNSLRCSCGKWFCMNCRDKFEIIDNKTTFPLFCELCLKDRIYQNINIVCHECINSLKTCSECGKQVCKVHSERFNTNEYYCEVCAVNERAKEHVEDDEEQIIYDETDEVNDDDYSYIKEVPINDFLTLKLGDNGSVDIFVNGEFFDICKYLLINIPTYEVERFDEINSIDEAAELLNHSMENEEEFDEHNLNPEELFWGHASNIQAWVESKYNTCLLHRNLAFPLLKKLTEAGDPVAKEVFKHEIAKRIDDGCINVVYYLIIEGYLKYLDREEIQSLFEINLKLDQNLLHALESGDKNLKNIAKGLLERLFKLTHEKKT